MAEGRKLGIWQISETISGGGAGSPALTWLTTQKKLTRPPPGPCVGQLQHVIGIIARVRWR